MSHVDQAAFRRKDYYWLLKNIIVIDPSPGKSEHAKILLQVFESLGVTVIKNQRMMTVDGKKIKEAFENREYNLMLVKGHFERRLQRQLKNMIMCMCLLNCMNLRIKCLSVNEKVWLSVSAVGYPCEEEVL